MESTQVLFQIPLCYWFKRQKYIRFVIKADKAVSTRSNQGWFALCNIIETIFGLTSASTNLFTVRCVISRVADLGHTI